jgi:hypothetical protein
MDGTEERDQAIEFASYMLMKIKKAATSEAFYAIIDNGIVLDDLLDNYGYYHMYPPSGVIDLLTQREPLIKRYGLTEAVK